MPGTPDYMPPEFAPRLRKGVLEFNDRGTPQSDIYPLGLCLYESFAGKPAYPRLSGDDVQVWLAFMERAEKPPKLDFSHPAFVQYPKLKDVICKAIDQNPKKRFASAEIMRRELRGIIPGLFLDSIPGPVDFEEEAGPVTNVTESHTAPAHTDDTYFGPKTKPQETIYEPFPPELVDEPPPRPTPWNRKVVKRTAIGIAVALILGLVGWIMVVVLLGSVDSLLESGATTAVGKKNWLFIGHPEAGERSAILYTILENCRRLGINPQEYMHDVLTRLPTTTNWHTHELTPANWLAARRKQAA